MYSPSGYQNISIIMRSLGKRFGVAAYGGSRYWLFVECDGLIFDIVEKLIENVIRCESCKSSFYGVNLFHEHKCYVNNNNVNFVYEFAWAVPIPGMLHIEMTLCKSFINTNWDVFVHEIVKVLGFKSAKALKHIRNCGNHHKTFELMLIMYIALTDELLKPFLDHCSENEMTPNMVDYWEFSKTITDSQYNYVQQTTLSFLHSIMLFRFGIRNGNGDAALAGLYGCEPFIYARKGHPMYHRIFGIYHYYEAVMPSEIKEFMIQNISHSRTGNAGYYQGGDRNLEEVNGIAKPWMSAIGVPNDRDWQRVFRNLDKLDNIRRKLESAVGLRQPSQWSTIPAIKFHTVAEVRRSIRATGFLSGRNNEKCTDLSGKPSPPT